MIAFWTGKGMFLPEGYDEYILCKEIYHCTPTELAKQPSVIARRDIAIWNGIKEVEKQRQQHASHNR